MNTKPIIFSGPMVRALNEGRKTQTRRVVKPQPSSVDENGLWFRMQSGGEVLLHQPCPYGQPGDLLWVRETWAQVGSLDPGYLVYRATYPRCLPAELENVPEDIRAAGYRWRPSIHMPRWASRLTLYLTDVRVDRVQDITEDDAEAEGVDRITELTPYWGPQETPHWFAFMKLWDSINAKRGYSWAGNPWVWVLTFRVIHANVDDVLADPDRYIQEAA